jgi:chromate reductase
MRVLLISGSLRRGSHNQALLRAAARELPPAIVVDQLAGIGDLPAYDEDLDGERVPELVAALRAAIARADAALVATPEYNGSIPGSLKNAIDWASRPWPDNALRDKPVCVIGASTGLFGAVWAQADLRKVLDICGARVLPAEVAVSQAHEAFDGVGRLRDPELAAALRAAVRELLHHAGAERVAPAPPHAA